MMKHGGGTIMLSGTLGLLVACLTDVLLIQSQIFDGQPTPGNAIFIYIFDIRIFSSFSILWAVLCSLYLAIYCIAIQAYSLTYNSN